jgi:hypothetical protein
MGDARDSGLPPKIVKKKKKPEGRPAQQLDERDERPRKKPDDHGRAMVKLIDLGQSPPRRGLAAPVM